MTSPLIEWSNTLSVGVAEIDQQHKTLVDMLNELHVAIVEHHGSQASRKVLDRLAEYTRVHFATEEGLMRVLRYPGFGIHKSQHDELIGEVRALQQKLDSGAASISFELLHFLKIWLSKHITESDKRFGEFALARDDPKPQIPPPLLAGAGRPWWKFW